MLCCNVGLNLKVISLNWAVMIEEMMAWTCVFDLQGYYKASGLVVIVRQVCLLCPRAEHAFLSNFTEIGMLLQIFDFNKSFFFLFSSFSLCDKIFNQRDPKPI